MCIFSHVFLTAPATTEIYTLSLHDALPISFAHAVTQRHKQAAVDPRQRQPARASRVILGASAKVAHRRAHRGAAGDRKSTRLNSSHRCISYAVFCLKKKKRKKSTRHSLDDT